MISYDEALARIAACAEPLEHEEVPLDQARGRILAGSVIARISVPATDISAMDGIAVRDADLAALPVTLRVIGASCAGEPWHGKLMSGECVRIFTGASLPRGADRVVMQEHVHFDGEAATVRDGYGPGWHVRAAGADFNSGEMLVAAGTCLGPRQLLCAAAANHGRVSVWRMPRVGILVTGTELVPAGVESGFAYSLPDSVSHGVAALVAIWGGQVMARRLVADQLNDLRDAAGLMLLDADIVVVTGGASVGERDYAKDMFTPHGLDLIFSKLAIKPGKPVWLGKCGAKLVIGLPGNPTSAVVTARLILAPLLTLMSGRSLEAALAWRRLPVEGDVKADLRWEDFPRARLTQGRAVLLSLQDSGVQRPLADADILVRASTWEKGCNDGATAQCLDF